MPELIADLWRQHMLRGDFEAAWGISDRALRNRNCFSCCAAHEEFTWRGEPLHGRRVLVRCCYGLGDTLQFVRYIPLLHRVARHVALHAQASIAGLLEQVEGIDRLTTRYNAIFPETYDFAIALTELPHIFRTHLHTIPASVPYIAIAPRSLSPTTTSEWDLYGKEAIGIGADLCLCKCLPDLIASAGYRCTFYSAVAHCCSGHWISGSIQEAMIFTKQPERLPRWI